MNHRVIYIMGVSGCGKSTIALMLSEATGYAYYDGDDFHPNKNVQKMKSGQPLTDEDRYGWLKTIHDFAEEQQKQHSLIIACSALKEKYRETLSENLQNVHWVYLKGDYELILGRLQKRQEHFMPTRLLQSQFDALEEPEYALAADIRKPTEEIIREIKTSLSL